MPVYSSVLIQSSQYTSNVQSLAQVQSWPHLNAMPSLYQTAVVMNSCTHGQALGPGGPARPHAWGPRPGCGGGPGKAASTGVE